MDTYAGQLRLRLDRNSLSIAQGMSWGSCSRRVPVFSAYAQDVDRATDRLTLDRDVGWSRLNPQGARKRWLPAVRKVSMKGFHDPTGFRMVEDEFSHVRGITCQAVSTDLSTAHC